MGHTLFFLKFECIRHVGQIKLNISVALGFHEPSKLVDDFCVRKVTKSGQEAVSHNSQV